MLTPWRVRRARAYVLAAIAAVLTGTVSSYLYRRPPPPAPDPAPVAEEVSQQTRSFSLSKTLGENTLYTITAEQVTNFENTGQALLRNVAVVIYGKDGSRRDRIASPECYYDPAASSIWIPGDVEMQFTIPQPGTMAGGADAPATAISIFTSRLSFEQSTGLASTDAPVRFVLPQGEGRSQGAAYDPGKQILTLKAGVSFQFRGDAGAASAREPVVVHAGTAHLVRETGKAVLEHSVAVARGPQRIRAARGEIALDAGRRVRQMTLAGGVAATQETTNAFLQANAESGTLLLEPNGRMRSLTLKERVSWQMARPGGGNRREGAAQEVSLLFRDADGLLERLQAWREVRMSFHRGPEAAAGGGEQSLSGGAAELFPAPGSNQLQEATITGAPRLELLPRSAGAEQHTVTGDVFRIRLNESGELSRFQASGNVRLVAEIPGSPASRRESRSDALEATFSSPAGESGGFSPTAEQRLEQLRQWGRFEYRDPQWQARAEQARYEPQSATITLTGGPAVWNAEGRLTATRIALDTDDGGIQAEGSVAASLFPQPANGDSAAEPLHVVADRMRYRPAGKHSRFEGHARLWQSESFLVEAETLDWLQQPGELRASETVYSVFRPGPQERSSSPSAANSRSPRRPESDVVIVADSLVYQSQRRWARYRGAVRMRHGGGSLTASELEVFLRTQSGLTSASQLLNAGGIERIVAQQQVRIVEDGRVATGDRAVYQPALETIRLFGQPARVSDAARGTVQGVELTYHLGDDRIQVQGSPGSPTETRWQVHR